MDSRALADCASFLGREPAEVLKLRDDADLLPALLARLGNVFAAGRTSNAEAREPREAFCLAVVELYGDEQFTAARLLEWCAERRSRRPLQDAARALCRTDDSVPTARQLGIALRRVCELPVMWFTVEGHDDRGTMVWRVRDLRD
jgi:hypothetical protein